MNTFYVIDSHLHCGIQNVNWVWERIKPLHLAAGITGAALIPPVEDVYDRYNPHFTDSPQWQACRRRAHQYLLGLNDSDVELFRYFFVWNDFAWEDLTADYVAIKWHRHPDEPVYNYADPRCGEFLQAVKNRGLPILLEETLANPLMFLEKLLPPGVPLIIPHLGGLSRIFGQGVLRTEGETHHRQRRLFLPFFHGNHVTAYTNLITAKAHDIVGQWQDGTTVNIEHEMAHLTLSVIWRLLFGRDVESEAEPIREAIMVGQSLIKLQNDSLLASFTPLWVPTKLHRRFTRGHRSLEAIIHGMIEERRLAPHQNDDVLALLHAARDPEGRPLSDDEIRDELVTFLLAGHETTANALTWTWFLLSQFRSIRERITCGLNEVLGDRLPTAADMPRLRYTKMVWEESLRLYPPAWSLHTLSPMLRTGFHRAPLFHPVHGSSLVPGVCTAMRAGSRIPTDLILSGFRKKQSGPAHRSATFPFGAGGRRCLGASFAELEGLLILATIASKFRLRLVEGQAIHPEPMMTLRPNVPVLITVQRIGISTPHPAVV